MVAARILMLTQVESPFYFMPLKTQALDSLQRPSLHGFLQAFSIRVFFFFNHLVSLLMPGYTVYLVMVSNLSLCIRILGGSETKQAAFMNLDNPLCVSRSKSSLPENFLYLLRFPPPKKKNDLKSLYFKTYI